MRTKSRIQISAVLVAVGTAFAAVMTGGVALASGQRPMGVHVTAPGLPQTTAADRGAAWIASKVTAQGDVVMAGTPDLSDTTLTILALAATGTERAVARRALSYMEHHVDAYVQEAGVDRPGELATLILDAHVLGMNPRSFGGTNLVQRLVRTMRSSGHDAGLFGAQDPTYDGTYREGLALMALAAAEDTNRAVIGVAVRWLQHQQCADGGWEAYRASTATSCTKPDPTTYSGPDTNSTALAVEGLTAQRATFNSPMHFLTTLETATGGWGYYGGASDPDSTALVVQAILALHDSVTALPFRRGPRDPVSAMLSFQLRNGAFYYPGARTANALSTEQVVPALANQRY